MKAAIVYEFGQAPQYGEYELQALQSPHKVYINVIAAGLHQRVRSQADGSHYTSIGKLPLVPGVDGVGRLPDGRLVYFVMPDDSLGSMAEQTIIDPRRSLPIPDGADPIQIAAVMNPAMSSWVTLRQRSPLKQGSHVLVMGATGSSGQMAVQIAKLLGAERVIAAGRHSERLNRLTAIGADTLVSLEGEPSEVSERLGEAAADVDVVIDYLWGKPAEWAIPSMLKQRQDRSHALDWIQIGSMAGATANIPAAALRSANFRLLGSGQGSLSPTAYLAEFPALINCIAAGTLKLPVQTFPLADVEQAWNASTDPQQRIVLLPGLV
ncbi:quinone oxidoreductase family protein [Paenibacillus wenxiniae]|uniref:Zinc-binding alcohol dehydrogenase family protein n=1 Tax=Paenibacillus wenxiniae TaxID=1636843 RepID=A0ABW4RLI5_9BACL